MDSLTVKEVLRTWPRLSFIYEKEALRSYFLSLSLNIPLSISILTESVHTSGIWLPVPQQETSLNLHYGQGIHFQMNETQVPVIKLRASGTQKWAKLFTETSHTYTHTTEGLPGSFKLKSHKGIMFKDTHSPVSFSL